MTFWILLLLFTALPALEIAAFLRIGGFLGLPSTLAIVLLTGVAGAMLARSQGFRVLTDIQKALERGAMPTDGLLHGAFVLLGGALLLTPGFLTDAFGLSCLLPPTRHALAWWVKRFVSRRIQRAGGGGVEVMGWNLRTGAVRPGPAAKEKRFDLGEDETLPSPGPQTIDATFTVVDGAEGDSD